MDKHVSRLSIEQINRHLRDLCLKSLGSKNKKDKVLKIPLNSIISSIEERFGYYLPYLILKKSKKIKKIKIEKIMEKKNKIQDIVSVKMSDYFS